MAAGRPTSPELVTECIHDVDGRHSRRAGHEPLRNRFTGTSVCPTPRAGIGLHRPGPRPGGRADARSGQCVDQERWPGSCGLAWAAPALVSFAADAGAFSALCGEDVGVAGVLVAPPQVGLQPAGQGGVVGVVRRAHGEGPQRPELGFDGVGPGRVGRGEAEFDLVPRCPGADGGCLVRREVSMIT